MTEPFHYTRWSTSIKPILEAEDAIVRDLFNQGQFQSLFYNALPKAKRLTSFKLDLTDDLPYRFTWLTPDILFNCLTQIKHTNITHLTIHIWPESIPLRDAIYRWLSQDNQLVTFTYECPTNADYDLEQFVRIARHHPTLRSLHVDEWMEEMNDYLKREVEDNWLRRHRMVHLLVEPPVPKDILRHIFTFIK